MNYLPLFLVTYVLGVAAAIPVGGAQVEVVRRTAAGRRGEAIALMAGCAFTDMLYGVIGLFGLAPMLTTSWISVAVRGAGAVVMILLGVHALRTAGAASHLVDATARQGAPRTAFLTGVSLSAASPLIVFWWALGFKVVADVGLVHTPGAAANIVFVVGGVMGMSTYLLIISDVVRRMQHRLRPRTVMLMIRGCGVWLIGSGIVLGIRSLGT